MFGVTGEPITQLLDRVSREGIEITNGDERNASFYEYLKEKAWIAGVWQGTRLSQYRPKTVRHFKAVDICKRDV